jgi:hypothetical protein
MVLLQLPLLMGVADSTDEVHVIADTSTGVWYDVDLGRVVHAEKPTVLYKKGANGWEVQTHEPVGSFFWVLVGVVIGMVVCRIIDRIGK